MKNSTIIKNPNDLFFQKPDGTLQEIDIPKGAKLVQISLTQEEKAAKNYFQEEFDITLKVTPKGLTVTHSYLNLSRRHIDNDKLAEISHHAQQIANLKILDLANTQISDVTALASLANLIGLYLANTQVSDVTALASLINLKYLYLENTQVSDVTALKSLTNLIRLTLENTQISDVTALEPLPNLKSLYLENTQVPQDAVQKLEKALPTTLIFT